MQTAQAINCGVVKLENAKLENASPPGAALCIKAFSPSHMPSATKRADVMAFLGHNSRILNDGNEPVHIIMKRVTSKTMDLYVEFMSLEDAIKAVDKHHHKR